MLARELGAFMTGLASYVDQKFANCVLTKSTGALGRRFLDRAWRRRTQVDVAAWLVASIPQLCSSRWGAGVQTGAWHFWCDGRETLTGLHVDLIFVEESLLFVRAGTVEQSEHATFNLSDPGFLDKVSALMQSVINSVRHDSAITHKT